MLHFLGGAVAAQRLAVAMEHEITYVLACTTGKTTARPPVFVCRSKQVHTSWIFFCQIPPHVHTNFRGPRSWLWRKCNRLLRLGRPWGAVTLSRLCVGWYIGRWGARRALRLIYWLPRPWSPRGSSPYKENSHGRAWNRTRDLVISSQKLRPRGWSPHIMDLDFKIFDNERLITEVEKRPVLYNWLID